MNETVQPVRIDDFLDLSEAFKRACLACFPETGFVLATASQQHQLVATACVLCTEPLCSDDRLMGSIDARLGDMLTDFKKRLHGQISGLSDSDKRRIAGLYCLANCNRDDNPLSAKSIAPSAF